MTGRMDSIAFSGCDMSPFVAVLQAAVLWRTLMRLFSVVMLASFFSHVRLMSKGSVPNTNTHS